jgi:hypothetical protein
MIICLAAAPKFDGVEQRNGNGPPEPLFGSAKGVVEIGGKYITDDQDIDIACGVVLVARN